MAGRDDAGNAVIGDVLTWASCDSYTSQRRAFIAMLGVEDLVVVATKDAVLVARKDRNKDVRRIVERLRLDRSKCV